MVDIFYTHYSKSLTDERWLECLELLSTNQREQNTKYLRWQDRHAYVLGKLLLRLGLIKYGFDSSILSKIQYTRYGRPFLNEKYRLQYFPFR